MGSPHTILLPLSFNPRGSGRETVRFFFGLAEEGRMDPKPDPTLRFLFRSRATCTFLGASTAFGCSPHRTMGEPEVTGSGGVEENRDDYDEYDDEMMANPTPKV